MSLLRTAVDLETLGGQVQYSVFSDVLKKFEGKLEY